MAPSKKQDGRKKRNSKSASENDNVITNTRRSSSRSSSRKSSCDSGKNIPDSNISSKKSLRDRSSGGLGDDCESVQDKSIHDNSDIDLYADLAEDIDDNGEKETNGNHEPNSFESDLKKDLYHMEENSKTPIKEKTVVASKKLEDKINTKQKDVESNSEIIKKTKPKRKSNKDEVLDQANLDLFDDLIISRKNQVSSKEVLELRQELERVNGELYKSREHCAKLEEDNEQLLKNTSALWKTALAQIRGKITEISALKREKEQIIFRRAMRQVARDDLDRAVSRIAAYNKEEFTEFMESMKKEPSCNCGGTGAQTNNPGQKHGALLTKNIQEKVLGNRVGANDDRDALMLQKHLGKAGQKMTSRPDLQQKQKHFGTNRQHINKREEGFNKKKEVISKNNEDKLKMLEQSISRERATMNRLSKVNERCDRYGEEVRGKRLEGHDHRSIWKEDGDEGRHDTRSNTKDDSRKNEFRFESGDERYDSRKTRSTHSKEGQDTNKSDGELLNDRRSVRNKNSRSDIEKNLSDDEVYSSRRRTRSKDKKDLKNRNDRSEKNELVNEDKRSRNKRKRSESPDKDIRIKRESRRNKSKDAKQRESNAKMSVFERLGRNKAEKTKTDDLNLENHLQDQTEEESIELLEKRLSDANSILKKISSDDSTHKELATPNGDNTSKTQNQMGKNEEAEELNVDINDSVVCNDYDQIAENVQLDYDDYYDNDNYNSKSFVARDIEENNMNSINVSKKRQDLGSLNDENGMPNTLFAQRMKDRLAGKSSKTVTSPKLEMSPKITLKTNLQCSLDTEAAANDVLLPDILKNLVPSSNSCEFKSVKGNSSYDIKSEEPKIKKDVTHPVSGNENSALKETNSNINNNPTNSNMGERKTCEASEKTVKGKQNFKGCLKDLLLTLKKSNNTVSSESKTDLECKDKFAYNNETSEREDTDTVSDAENALQICEEVVSHSENIDKVVNNNATVEICEPITEAVLHSENKDKVADNYATVGNQAEESASNDESGLEIDETVNLDIASSHGSKTSSLGKGKDKVADNDEAVERKEKAECHIKSTLESEPVISLQLNDEPINLDNTTSHVLETTLESTNKLANNDKTTEIKENKTVSDRECNVEAEQTNSLRVNDCGPVNLDNDFDSLEDILSDMGLKVSPKHDSTPLPYEPLDKDKDIKMNLMVEEKANSSLMSPYKDKAIGILSSPVESGGRSILMASVDELGNKEILDTPIFNSLDKVLEVKTNCEVISTVEEKDYNKQVLDGKVDITKDVDKILKKSFRIPKLKKTPNITEEFDRIQTNANTLEHPRRSKRRSTEGIENDDQILDKNETDVSKTDSIKTECTARKADSRTCREALKQKESKTDNFTTESTGKKADSRICSEVLKQKESQIDSEKKITDSLTSSEIEKQKESLIIAKNKLKSVPDKVVNKSIQIPKSLKNIKNRIESDSCSDEQESNSSSDEQVIRSKVRKSKTQRSKVRKLRIESDSSTDEEIKKETLKSPIMKTLTKDQPKESLKSPIMKIQTKDQPIEYPSVTRTSPNKSPTDIKCLDKSQSSDVNKESITVDTSFPQHFKRRVKKKHSSVVLTAVSSTVVNCSPNKNYPENISVSNSKEISETKTVKSLDKVLDLKENIEAKSSVEENDCKAQNPDDSRNITEDTGKLPPSEDNINMNKNKFRIPKVKNTISVTKEADGIKTSRYANNRGSNELKDTMNILKNIVARNIPKQITENLESKDSSEKITTCLKDSETSNIESKADDTLKGDTFDTVTMNGDDKHMKTENKKDKDIHKKERKSSDDIESKVHDMLKCDKIKTDTKKNSDEHTKKDNTSERHILKKDKKSKKISLLFDEDVQVSGKLSSGEEGKKSISLNYEKEKKHLKGGKQNVKVAKKISSLFDEEIPDLTEGMPSLSESNMSKTTLIDSLTDERQNKEAIFSSESSIRNTSNVNENLSENKETTEDKNYLKKTKSQRVFEPKLSSNSVEEKSKNLDTEVMKEVIGSVTEHHSPLPKIGDPKDQVISVGKESKSETEKYINIVTEDMNKDVFETPKVVNKSEKDTFNKIISPTIEKHSNIHIDCSDNKRSSEKSPRLEDKHTFSKKSECLEDNIFFTEPECLENKSIPSEEFKYVENKNIPCMTPVHNEDFLELFATESLAGDTDIEASPVKKQGNKAKEIKNANTNVDKWKQSFSGRHEKENIKSKDKTNSFTKVDFKSAFGIQERKVREPEIENKMSRKVIKEKGKKTEIIIENKSLKDNAIDKRATKSVKTSEKSKDEANAECRRSPRKHQNPIKRDDGDRWFPSEDELLFDESDSSIEDEKIVTDASRNLFDEKLINSKSEGENLSSKISKDDESNDKSYTVSSLNNKENTKERNHKTLSKSVSAKNDTRRTSSRHKDEPLSMRERRSRSSPSRERRSDRKLRSPVRSPNRKLRSPVRSPNRKLRSPVRSPNRKLRSPVRSPNRKLRSPVRSPDRKLRSPLRSPEKHPRQKRDSPKGRTSPRSKHVYESNVSPKGRLSPKRKETDYRARERNRREDRRQDSDTINSRERSTRSRKESTHDERRTRHSSGEEKRSKDDHRKRLDYKDKQRDRDERTKEIRGRSDERPRKRERELKENVNVVDRMTEEKLSVEDDKREETFNKTEGKPIEGQVSETKLVENVPISKAPVNPELIKKFTEDQSSDKEEGELDEEEEGEIKESENELETEENFSVVENNTALNKKSRRLDENDTEREELQPDAKIRDLKTKNYDNTEKEDSKSKDNFHKEQKDEIHKDKRISRKEDKNKEFNSNKEENKESKTRKESEELIDEVEKDEHMNKRKKNNELEREKDKIPSDSKYKDRKIKDEDRNKNFSRENKFSRREPPQEFYRNKVGEKSRAKDTKPLQRERVHSPKRSERSRRRITPVRIGNSREIESRHRLRSRSPRKTEHSRRNELEKTEDSHERKSGGRVITDRRESTPLIDHSKRPVRRIKPITIESEPDPSTLFTVKRISEPKQNFFIKFMNSIGLESQQNVDDNVDYLGRSKTVKNQMYSDSNACGTKNESKTLMHMNVCDDSEMSLLQYIGKDQKENKKSLEMESVDETDACQILQEKMYAENTVTMVETYKLEEIEKFICKDNSKKSPFDLRKLHPLDPRLKLLSKNRTSVIVTDEKVESHPVDTVKNQDPALQEEDVSSSIDLCKQLELSSDVNQDSNSNGIDLFGKIGNSNSTSIDLFGKIENSTKVMNTATECSKKTSEPAADEKDESAADEKDESNSDDSSSSDDSTTEDSSSCPAAPSSSSRSSNFISSSSRSSHINSISKSPKTLDTSSSATKRLNFGDFKIPKSLSDDNSVLPDVVFPLKSGNNPIAVQFGNQVSALNQDSKDISPQDKEIENSSSELGNKCIEMDKGETVSEISQTETTKEIRIPKNTEDITEKITEENAQQTSPKKKETTNQNPILIMGDEQIDTDNCQMEEVQEDITSSQDKSTLDEETMVMEDLHLESDSDSNSDHSNCECSKCGNSSSSSSSSSSSDSDTSSQSEGEDGDVGDNPNKITRAASDAAKSPQSAVRRSSRNCSLSNKSPTKSTFKSPTKSPSKSPLKSLSKSYLSPPLTPRTPKTANKSNDPEVNLSPSMPRLFDSTPKKSPKKHNLSYKKTPSPHKFHKSKTPKKSIETSKSKTKMSEHISDKGLSKSPCKKLMAVNKSPRKSPRKSPSKIMSPEKSMCKMTSPKTPGKSPCKSLRSPCKKLLAKSPLKSNKTPCKFASPEKSPWKTSSPRTPGKDLMASMMSPPLGAFTSPGKTRSHLWKSPKKTIHKNEPLLLNDHIDYLPFQSPSGEKSIDLIDEDIYNSPVLKKDENIAVKDDELSLLLDLENLATETEKDENEEIVHDKSLSITSGEDDSVLSALALSPEETPVRPRASKQENITPKSVKDVNFRKESLAKVDITPKVCNVLSTPKTNNGVAEIMEHFSITPKVNLELQATSTPKLYNTETPKTGRSKLLQQEIHVTPITTDDSTPKSSHSETTVKSNKTFMESLEETPKSHKVSADYSKELSLEGISRRSFNDTPNNISDAKAKNNSIVGVSALHNNSVENKGNSSNNVSGSSKDPSPGSPRRVRAYVTASGQLRVPRRRPNFGSSNVMPTLSCSQPIMNSVSIVHNDENNLSHKKQLFPTRENGPAKRALSPSVSPMAETENMPDKRLKIMSPRSYHQNVAKRSLVTEGSTQQVTKKLLTGDSSSNLSSNSLNQTATSDNIEESKKSNTSSTVVQPLSLIGSNQTVIVRRKKRKRDFNPTKT